MAYRCCVGILVLALGYASAASSAVSQIIDMSKYPDIAGGWGRSEVYGWTPRGETPPLTEEYQAVVAANRAARARGGHGTDVMYRCFPPGMPRQMLLYTAMEVVITPKATYMLIDHIHDNRRIYTDGREWPHELEPLFSGHSIGKWVDEDGDGKYDVLEVETRFLKGPRTLDGLLPTHADNQTVVKERIYLDKANPDILHNEITLIDNAYTRPWTTIRNYPRLKKAEPIWWAEEICAENAHVTVGKEDYFVSADGYLMPVRKDQSPPDLRYFQQTTK